VHCFVVTVQAQHDLLRYIPGTFIVQPFVKYAAAGVFYDSTGQTVSRQVSDANGKIFISSYSKVLLSLTGSYAVDSSLFVMAEVPFSYSGLQEDYIVNGELIGEKSNLTLTSPEYYKLGAEYLIRNRVKMRSSLLFSVTSAAKFSGNNISAEYYPIYPAGAMIWTLGVTSAMKFTTTELLGSVLFNARTAGLSNELNVRAEVRLLSLTDVLLSFSGGLVQTFGSRKNIVFDKRYMPSQETFMTFGGGLNLKISDRLFGTTFYHVRAFGYNTWGLSEFGVSAGFIL